MPEALWMLIFGVLVVVAVFLFKRFAVPVTGLGALAVTILACIIAAGIFVAVTADNWNVLAFTFATLVIYAIANLTFQIITKAQK